MGCDIHLHVEIRCNGKWEHYACPSTERWYALFGVMAGVRGEGPAIVDPKGVPSDMSIITRLDYEKWGVDAHTASWLDEEEIDKLIKWLHFQEQQMKDQRVEYAWNQFNLESGVLCGTYMFGNSLTAFKHFSDVEYIPKCCDAVRIVFWFDN